MDRLPHRGGKVNIQVTAEVLNAMSSRSLGLVKGFEATKVTMLQATSGCNNVSLVKRSTIVNNLL